MVKSEEDSHLHTQENNESLQHGTAILKYIVLPWDNSERGVCADSYFASVYSVEEMMRIGVRFIGVVKTATKKRVGINPPITNMATVTRSSF